MRPSAARSGRPATHKLLPVIAQLPSYAADTAQLPSKCLPVFALAAAPSFTATAPSRWIAKLSGRRQATVIGRSVREPLPTRAEFAEVRQCPIFLQESPTAACCQLHLPGGFRAAGPSHNPPAAHVPPNCPWLPPSSLRVTAQLAPAKTELPPSACVLACQLQQVTAKLPRILPSCRKCATTAQPHSATERKRLRYRPATGP